MPSIVDFLFLSDANVRCVVLGMMLLCSSTALIGTFALLNKQALVGDAVAHAVLPGLCIAFLITGTKDLFYLVFGAFATGWLATLLIHILPRYSKLKEDTAIALILSVSFGIGSLLLTTIQHAGNAAQLGLKYLLLGNAAALIYEDLTPLLILSLVLMGTVLLFFKEFTLLAFDKVFAKSLGLPVKQLEFLLTSLTVLAIIVGIRMVGIVLMSAMLITPAAAARFWTNNLLKMMLLAVGFSLLSGLVGTFISYTAPAMPTGPWIVLTASAIAYISFFFAPARGMITKRLQRKKSI